MIKILSKFNTIVIKMILKIIIFICFINKINNDYCNKDKPILYDDSCEDRYCTKEEFEDNICSINNNISKIQWLNKINCFSKDSAYEFTYIKLSNNDILFISLGCEIDGPCELYLYGLKSTGEKLFQDENGNDFKIINIIDNLDYLNAINVKIDNKEYPLICSGYSCFLIDYYDNNQIYSNGLLHFFKNSSNQLGFLQNNPQYFPIINLNQENQILFIIIYGYESISFNFAISNILSKNITSLDNLYNLENVYDQTTINEEQKMCMLSCFMNEAKIIECLYYESNYYKVGIYSNNLNYITDIKLDDREIDDDDDQGFKQLLNCIHLKEEIGVFIYYINMNLENPALILQINELIENNGAYSFKNITNKEKIILSLDNTTLVDHNDLEGDTRYLMKINNNSFSYIYDYYDEESNIIIILIIFELYGNNFDNLIVKYYKINPKLFFGNFIIDSFYKINTFTFNSFIGFASIYYYTYDEDESKLESIYIIFGDSEKQNNNNEIVLNINENYEWKIKDDFNIDINNNLFGYEIIYKIKSVQDSLQNLKFYSANNNREININDEINYNDILLFDYSNIIIKIDDQPFFEIMALIIEPDYYKSLLLCDKYAIYGEDQKNFYQKKIIDEKIIKIKLNFNFKCYLTCETCEYSGLNINKQNCLSCKGNNYCFMENEGNCYDTLSLKYYFYKDLEDANKLKCIPFGEYCTEKYPYEITNTKECVKESNYEDLTDNIINILDNINSITSVFNIIYNKIKEGSLDEYINKGLVIYKNNMTILLSNTSYQKYYIDNGIKTNFSIIDLSECEKKLGYDKSLNIVKMDIYRNDSLVPQVEYLILNPNNHEKIDLSVCEDTKIDIYLPFDLPEESLNLYNFANEQGYNIFNPSDSFYNDICTPFNSKNKTDVLIKDRKEDYYNDEYAFCEEDCDFDNININLNKIKCNCEIKKEIMTDTKFSSNKLLENFYKIDSYSNFRIIICYNLIFSKDGQKNNYRSYIILCIIILFISTTFINIFTNDNKTNKILELIIEQQKKLIDINKNNENKKITIEDGNSKELIADENTKKNIKKRKKKKKKLRNVGNNIIKDKTQSSISLNFINSDKKSVNKEKHITLPSQLKKNKTIKHINGMNNIDKDLAKPQNEDIIIFEKKNSFMKITKQLNIINKKKNDKIINIIINKIEKEFRKKYFSNEELNSLKYEYAIEIDNRSYIQYYLSLLKLKHLIIFTFITNDDYNIFLLKFGFFLISFSLFFTVNAMFFSDDSIHKQYKEQGKFNFIYQIPQILYSTIITSITNMLLKKLSLSQNDILKLKRNLDIQKVEEASKKIKKCLKLKFILFTIIGLILLIFFWYYLSAFCCVFVNTQISLIKDSAISYGLSMLYPFGLNLLPGILRIPSLRNNRRRILYNISKIVAFI